jgi:hypothetical protein
VFAGLANIEAVSKALQEHLEATETSFAKFAQEAGES